MSDKVQVEISVGSSAEFEELVAEITFGEYFGLIISQESGEGSFEVTAHSLTPEGAVDFQYGRSPAGARVSLSDFTKALETAVQRLHELQRQPGAGGMPNTN
jgi:hypothetical protein